MAVALGEGLTAIFHDLNVDQIVDGGQSKNPSTDDFIHAFDKANADVIFVLPNNGNIILAARQAAKLYDKSDVRVIESHTVGDCYAILSMLDLSSGDAGQIEQAMVEAMSGVVTAGVSRCVRNTEMDGFALKDGEYIGFVGKEILSADDDRRAATCLLADQIDFTDREICILVRGVDSTGEEAEQIAAHIRKAHAGCEVYIIDGGQEVYSYLMIIE